MRTFIAESALTLLVIIDPIGWHLSASGLLTTESEAARLRIARHAVIIAGVVLLAFMAVAWASVLSKWREASWSSR